MLFEDDSLRSLSEVSTHVRLFALATTEKMPYRIKPHLYRRLASNPNGVVKDTSAAA